MSGITWYAIAVPEENCDVKFAGRRLVSSFWRTAPPTVMPKICLGVVLVRLYVS